MGRVMSSIFPIYVFAAVLGTVLLLFSVGFGMATDADADPGAGGDADLAGVDGADADAGGADAEHGGLTGVFGALLSLRFWTFFATFFGLAGILVDGLDLLEGTTAPASIAVLCGAAAGLAAVRVLRALSRPAGGEVPEASAYVGVTGRVLVRATPRDLGKIRIELSGRTVDLLARSVDGETLAPGDAVLILEMQGETALAAPYGDSAADPTGSANPRKDPAS